MKKNVIIDLHGVVFEPIDDMVMRATIKKYGYLKTAALLAAAKMGVASQYVEKNMATLVADCAMQAKPKEGAFEALERIMDIPDIDVYVCSTSCFPSMAPKMENYYRSLASPLAAVKHYELLQPMGSKERFAYDIIRANRSGITYVVDNKLHNLRAAYSTRQWPVLVAGRGDDCKRARDQFCARQFNNLVEFADFLARHFN